MSRRVAAAATGGPHNLLRRAGLVEAARFLGGPWQPTAGHMGTDGPRRIDGFRLSWPAWETGSLHGRPRVAQPPDESGAR